MSRKSAGLRAWLWQRLSAVYMLIFISIFVMNMIFNAPQSYMEWQSWISNPYISVACTLFFYSLLAHAWIGMRDVVMDYIHPVGIRLVILSVIAVALIGMAFWVLKILFIVG